MLKSIKLKEILERNLLIYTVYYKKFSDNKQTGIFSKRFSCNFEILKTKNTSK